MSEGSLQFKGAPTNAKSELSQDINPAAHFTLFSGCGLGGNGVCLVTIDTEHKILEFKVSKYIVYNRKIVFTNPSLTGIRIYTDAGPAGLCDHSLGTEVTWWFNISSDGNVVDVEAFAKTGVELSGVLPYEIEFTNPRLLPQPTDAAWDAKIYAYIWWGNPDYVAARGFTSEAIGSLHIAKHDYDIKV